MPLNKALNETHWVDNINEKLWLKLLINVAINPLTAIYQVKNGQLLAPEFATLINRIIKESVLISKAEKMPFSEEELLATVTQVISKTAENYSSMNRDIHFKRKTENEYISGYLLAKAAKHAINVPTIAKLHQKIDQYSLYKEGESLSNSIK
ncbi:ketopantoate reductase C-terminal domain-containing protein [Psychromonas sp. MME2]|uniref:ketopantoate reductase family protein n=1 Tax=Psychromonas sp. MME2 TaxID=3231033 RepID=UPI00339C382A